MASMTEAAPPLDQPYYRAPFLAAVGRVFSKYATFSGRASRSEFWWWYLVVFAVPILVQTLYGTATGDWNRGAVPSVPDTITGVFSLATFIPTVAVTWRRLHDTNRTGAWWFFGFIPILGWIVLLIFLTAPADPAGRVFDDPRYDSGR